MEQAHSLLVGNAIRWTLEPCRSPEWYPAEVRRELGPRHQSPWGLFPRLSGGRGAILGRHPDDLRNLPLAWEILFGHHLVITLG